MPPKNNDSGANGWIVVAAYEMSLIRKRWKIFSWRQFAEELHIDRRTLSKLDARHLDDSLMLETLDRIYAALLLLCPVRFTAEEMDEEYSLLVRSRIRILMCSEVHPEIRKLLEDGI